MPQFIDANGTTLHVSFRPGSGRPIVFSNSLGTDFRIWEGVVELLPDAPILRLDKRGHGLSAQSETSIAQLAEDTAAAMEYFGLTDALVCGVSVGGLIAQQLGHARPELASRLVLCDTGMKIGNDEIWNERIEIAKTKGTAAMADATMARWFSPDFHANRQAELAGYKTMLSRIPGTGYAAVSMAIRDCDLSDQTPTLTQPTTVIVGQEDKATVPALNKALANTITGATYIEIPGVGHLPCIETPNIVADAIKSLL